MGNTTGSTTLHGESKLAALKFDTDEIHVLRKTWQDLADRNNGRGIDKETFLQYFPLNGLLGERLFAQFDTKKIGIIDFDDFILGLATVCRGTIDDKIHFVFNMYDVSHDNTVSKQDLSTLLNHIPKETLNHLSTPSYEREETHSTRERVDSLSYSNKVLSPEHEYVDFYTNQDMVEKAFAECDLNHEGRLTYEEFKMWVQRTPTVMEYIESILPYNGPKDMHVHLDKKETLPHMRRITSRLSLNGRSNTVSELAGDIFNHSTSTHSQSSKPRVNSIIARYGNTSSGVITPKNGSSSPSPMATSAAPNCINRNTSFSSVQDPPNKILERRDSMSEYNDTHDSEEVARQYLIQALDTTQNDTLREGINDLLEKHLGGGVILMSRVDSSEIYRTVVSMEAYLWKKGKSMFHILSKRYYLLSGNCMYYYSHKSDVRPRGVIFLTGSIIERLKDEDMELKGYFGFDITHQDMCTGEHHRHEKRILYCKSEDEREKWVTSLQHAAHVVPIEDDYVIGKELGRGRFSIVCECVHKVTGVHCAVKIIDKATIEPEEKSLLRTEIAVLKLVNHPNIIRMEGLYESKHNIYIVMEMLKGGELFERIVGRPRFSELEAAQLIKPLLESVAYLHDLGIVHRDLKPENILCGEELDDLKIADFGLSKMILPKEKMDSACGTLSYVAPEVLTMQGYGKEADLWSVGVIMFLLLCGKLPFDGDDHNEIIRSTIQADLKVNPTVWSKLSDEAKNMMTALLNKNPKERITARDSLKHPYIVMHIPHMKRSLLPPSLVRSTSRDSDVCSTASSSKDTIPPFSNIHGVYDGIASSEISN